ncbi:Ankyrin repeat-containing domain protein [Russula decolorans]|jgi:ankyrin repeat protein
MAEDRDKAAKFETHNRQLLEAARTDNVELLTEIFAKHGEYDINFQDGIGNTALHYAASHGSPEVLDRLLEHEGCDVDYINRLEGATPLHLAVKIEEPELRAYITDCLLDAGANMSIKDKDGQVPLDYVPKDDEETRKAFRRRQVENSVSRDDIASDEDDYDDEGEYSGSDEE